MVSTLALLAIGLFFAVVSNYFLMLHLFDRKEKEMLDNLVVYLEREEKHKKVEG